MQHESSPDLVRALRASRWDQRRQAAITLGMSGTKEAVAELVRMVEGRHRRWLSWYTLDDSLFGVDALGYTRSREVLSYLKEIYNTIETRHWTREVMLYYGGASTGRDIWGYVNGWTHIYTKARPALQKALQWGESEQDNLATLEEGGDPTRTTYDYNDNVHNAFKTAIKMLEDALSGTPASTKQY